MKVQIFEYIVNGQAAALKNIWLAEGANVKEIEHKLTMTGFTRVSDYEHLGPGGEKVAVWLRLNGMEFSTCHVHQVENTSRIIAR